jgi:hypothetical protein
MAQNSNQISSTLDNADGKFMWIMTSNEVMRAVCPTFDMDMAMKSPSKAVADLVSDMVQPPSKQYSAKVTIATNILHASQHKFPRINTIIFHFPYR